MQTYKIIDLEQNTPEWHTFRGNHLGGSDAPIICGVSPWKDELQLFYEKTGFKEGAAMTQRMQRGHDLEPEARSLLIEQTGIEFTPVVLESVEYPFLSASLDGINTDFELICEIKCPGKSTHEMALDGNVPRYYSYQMQHCMMISGATECFYFSYRPEDRKHPTALVKITRCNTLIQEILNMERVFWKRLIEHEAPPGPEIFHSRQ